MTGMPEHDDRRAELIAAALAGDLDPAEQLEFDRLRASDPTVDVEFAELGGTVAALGSLGRWHEAHEQTRVTPLASRRRWIAVLSAAACLAIGIVLGGTVLPLLDRGVTGPPGTLGAVEPIAFQGVAEGASIVGDVVAHTWGTETVLVIEGLPVGESFEVVLRDAEGREYSSGEFIGTSVRIDCRMNAAVMREDVVAVEIRGEGGDAAVAALPAVG